MSLAEDLARVREQFPALRRPEWVVLPNEASETLLLSHELDVVTRWFQEPSFCVSGAGNTTVNVKKEGGDGCTGWAIVPADIVLHLRDLAIVNEGIQSSFVFENGTLICQRVVFKASEASHISGVTGVKVALLECTLEPGASISLGDGSCELYMEDGIDTANLTVHGSPRKTGGWAQEEEPVNCEAPREDIESVSKSFCEEHQLLGAQCAIVVDGALTHSLAYGCSEAERVGLHCAFKILTATCVALLVEDGKISYDDNPLELLGAGPERGA